MSEDQTYRWLPVTHHHYISAQYCHIPQITLSRGYMGEHGGLGVEEGQPDIFTTVGKCWA